MYTIDFQHWQSILEHSQGLPILAAFRYSLRVLQIAFHPYCSPNVKQEQNAICST